ncbi:MAG: DHH family phosphoesterase [Oscillospiraceae bacterium]|nr:DHH family phosphoesterase [Oscillospiraceae bacterium]
MKNRKNFFKTAVIGLFLLALAFSAVSAFFNLQITVIELLVTLIFLITLLIFWSVLKKEAFSLFAELENKLSPESKESLENIPMPICLLGGDGEIVWYNSIFSLEVLGGENHLGKKFYEQFLCAEKDKNSLIFRDKKFTAFESELKGAKQGFKLLYLVDDTALKSDSEKFHAKKPSVIQIAIDNYDELLSGVDGSQKNFVTSRIEAILEKVFVAEANGILRKTEKDRFVAVIENKKLEELIRDKFSFLDRIRKSISSGHIYATLSIGIGKDSDDLLSSDLMARQALDMALGRGGDQVAVKSAHGYEFFGGLSKGVEKRAKVRSRMIASALCELIGECDNVVIMGHKMADFDCLGAAVGLYKAVSSLSKPVHICINREANLSKELITQLEKGGYSGVLISPEQSKDAVGANTLLIVVDTHNPEITECPELLSKAGQVVVIDHHRKMVNHIDKAVIFYHEPSASSTCEMVTELIQYFNDGTSISRLEAEALLSGIMLDTKNFIIKSGVRTFEAAAYLRRSGADLVRVNGWFASSIETYHQKAKLISSCEIINGCAISYQDEFTQELLLAVPQTADELMHIKEVSASFVMYRRDGVVSISARSFGDVNVQLIMEKMGGGGHLTMAGAQIKAESCLEVKEKLIGAIDEYFEENK